MRVILIALILIMSTPIVNAATIATVGGDTSDGGIVTITGNGFGSHTLDIEWTKDWIEAQNVGTDMNAKNKWSYIFTKGAGVDEITNVRSWSGSKSYVSRTDRAIGDYSTDLKYDHQTPFNEIFVTFWIYLDAYKPDSAINTQWKFWRINSGKTYTNPQVTPVDNPQGEIYNPIYVTPSRGISTSEVTIHCETDCSGSSVQVPCMSSGMPVGYSFGADNPPDGYNYWWPSISSGLQSGISNYNPTHGTWTRVELHGIQGTQGNSDGYFRNTVYKPGIAKRIGFEWNNLLVYSDVTCRNQPDPWQIFLLQNYFDTNVQGGAFDEAANFYFDDIYIQIGTQARVEICDNSNWNLATKCEVQKPTLWNDDGITFETNYGGSFNQDDTAYLFVIDDQGVVSAGKAVTLGGSASSIPVITAAPTSATNGEQITITGSNFGIKSSPAPVVFDDFEDGFDPFWSDTRHLDISSNNQRTQYSTRNAHNDFTNFDDQWGDLKAPTSPSSDTWYAHYYYYVDNNFDFGLGPQVPEADDFLANIKLFRLFPSDFNGDDFVVAYNWGGISWAYGDLGTQTYWNFDQYFGGGKGAWHLAQLEFKESSAPNVPDGKVKMWIDGNIVLDHPNRITYNQAQQKKYMYLIGFHQTFNVPNSEPYDPPNDFHMDDVYMDTTWQRIELCEGSTYANKGFCEIQIPTSWTTGQIRFTLRQGSLSGTAYLYVIDQNGVASTGKAISLETQASDSLLLYSTMDDANAIWQPSVSQNNFATQSQAIPGSSMISYESGLHDNAVRFNGIGPDNGGPLIFHRDNFDLNDLEGDGARVDFLIKYNENPQTISGNKWIARTSWDPVRWFNIEYTGATLFLDVYSYIDSTHKTNYNKFRAAPGPYDSFLTSGQWYWFTYTWRNNGAYKDEVHFYINGENQGCIDCNDYGADLPVDEGGDWLFSPILNGAFLQFSLDEVYSFDSYDVSGITGNFPTLNIPNSIELAFPGSGTYPVPLRDYSPTFEFIPHHNSLSSFNCNIIIDGNTVGTVNAFEGEYTVFQYPGILSKGSHSWSVDCGAMSKGPQTFSIDYWQYPLKNTTNAIKDNPGDGRPILINADTAWLMAGRLTREDVDLYFANRKAQGFNAVLIDPLLASGYYGTTANAYGNQPFLQMSPVDFTQPNPMYWSHIDYIISKADEMDFLVLLTPVYLGYNCGLEGWCSAVQQASEADMVSYANWLYTRYAYEGNIIYVHGGDIDADTYGLMSKVDAMAFEMISLENTTNSYSLPNHLHTAHCNRDEGAKECYTGSWLDIDNVYSSCDTVASETKQAWDRTPTASERRIIFFEGTYEGYGNADPRWADSGNAQCQRGQAYQSLLGGAFGGHVYGHEFWNFYTGWETTMFTYEGAQDMKHWHELFTSREWWDLVPDYTHTIMTNGYGSITDRNYGSAAMTSDGYTFIAYLPTQRTVTVDLTKIWGSKSLAYWYDPTDGSTTFIGEFSNTGNIQFTSPTTKDWVLVIDSKDAQFEPPGSLASSTATCSDNIQNQGETGIDCGGPCPACAVQETCFDNILNQDEVHTDCGGSTCTACECYEPNTLSGCTTTAGCAGEQICVDGSYSSTCTDADPNDSCPAIGDVVVLQNDESSYFGQTDACISQGQPTTTLTADCSMLGAGTRILYYFDTTGLIEGRTILSATLELTEFNAGTWANRTGGISPLTESWNANTVTWNSFSIPGGVFDTGEEVTSDMINTQKASFDVTNIIQSWADGTTNNGIILQDKGAIPGLDPTGYITIRTGQHSTITERPKLTLTFASTNGPNYNLDGIGGVNINDLTLLAGYFGLSYPQGDYDGSGKISLLDLVIHIQHWN